MARRSSALRLIAVLQCFHQRESDDAQQRKRCWQIVLGGHGRSHAAYHHHPSVKFCLHFNSPKGLSSTDL